MGEGGGVWHERESLICFKKLAPAIVEAGSLVTQERADVLLSPRAAWRQNLFFLVGPHSFLLRPSMD